MIVGAIFGSLGGLLILVIIIVIIVVTIVLMKKKGFITLGESEDTPERLAIPKLTMFSQVTAADYMICSQNMSWKALENSEQQ